MGCFVKVYIRKGLKVNADKSKVQVLNGERDWMDGKKFEHVSEFNYLRHV